MSGRGVVSNFYSCGSVWLHETNVLEVSNGMNVGYWEQIGAVESHESQQHNLNTNKSKHITHLILYHQDQIIKYALFCYSALEKYTGFHNNDILQNKSTLCYSLSNRAGLCKVNLIFLRWSKMCFNCRKLLIQRIDSLRPLFYCLITRNWPNSIKRSVGDKKLSSNE